MQYSELNRIYLPNINNYHNVQEYIDALDQSLLTTKVIKIFDHIFCDSNVSFILAINL